MGGAICLSNYKLGLGARKGAWLSQTADSCATLRYRLLTSALVFLFGLQPLGLQSHQTSTVEKGRHQEGQRGSERYTGQSYKGEDPQSLGEMLTDCLVPSTRPSFWNRGMEENWAPMVK